LGKYEEDWVWWGIEKRNVEIVGLWNLKDNVSKIKDKIKQINSGDGVPTIEWNMK